MILKLPKLISRLTDTHESFAKLVYDDLLLNNK